MNMKSDINQIIKLTRKTHTVIYGNVPEQVSEMLEYAEEVNPTLKDNKIFDKASTMVKETAKGASIGTTVGSVISGTIGFVVGGPAGAILGAKMGLIGTGILGTMFGALKGIEEAHKTPNAN